MTTCATTGRALHKESETSYLQANYSGESATTHGQTTVYVWRTLQQQIGVFTTTGWLDANYIDWVLLPVLRRVEG